MDATANPPKSDDRYAQLTRGAFIINDFLQNPHFRTYFNVKTVQKLLLLNVIFSCSKGVLVSELKPGKKYASFIKPIKPPYYFEIKSDNAPRPVRVY